MVVEEPQTILIIIGAFLIAVFAFVAVSQWIRAERDERRWRRKLREEHMAAVIRETRYGAKGGTRHDR